MTNVAPKLRARSRRKVESNNIVCCLIRRTLWTSNTWSLRRLPFRSINADALVVVLDAESRNPALDPAIAALVDDAIASGDLQLKSGRSSYLPSPAGLKARRLVVVVAAAAGAAGPVKAFRGALVQRARRAEERWCQACRGRTRQRRLPSARRMPRRWRPRPCDAAYLYRHTKPSAASAPAFAKFSLVCEKADARSVQQGLQRGAAIGAGVTLAREFANMPGNHCTPTFLGEQAKQLGKEHGLTVQVLDRKAVEKLGMGAFVAVAQGSVEPLRFIVARYDGAARSQAPVVLVGKGITFDTGGISIKPAAEMDEMKYDMGGAASVLGTLRAIAELKPKLNLVCLIPACDNMPERLGRQAGRCGDQHVGADDRDPEYRRRGPADPVRCADLRRTLEAGGGGRHRDADRCLRDRARQPPQRLVHRRRRSSPRRCSRPAEPRSTRAGACRSTTTTTRH